MTITYDKIADAAYIKISEKRVAETIPLAEIFIMDKDIDGGIIGLEILDASMQRDLIQRIQTGTSHFFSEMLG